MFAHTGAFASFSTDNIEVARAFYGDGLGIDVSDAGMGNLMLTFANGTVVLIYPKEDHVPAAHTVLNLMVDDVAAAVRSLTAAGVEIHGGTWTGKAGRGANDGSQGPDIAWFKDPAGNWIAAIGVTADGLS